MSKASKKRRSLRRERQFSILIEYSDHYLARGRFGGFHMDRYTVAKEATKEQGFRVRVCGIHRPDHNTPELCQQRLQTFRCNPTATYGGWVTECYRVAGRH